MTNTFIQLKNGKHKADNGCVIVIGGSDKYTGAPVFSACATFRSGADLVYVYTAPLALISIKLIYDAIVMPVSYDEKILDKASACVVGPGLGRCSEQTIKIITQMLAYLDSKGIPIIIDGDGIHYYKHSGLSIFKTCILTPNYKESEGLIVKQGHICIYKGECDKIIQNGTALTISTEGSPRRCGGQGDILTGILAVAVSLQRNDLLKACSDSCAFKSFGYSTTASDIIKKMPDVLRNILDN